MNTDTGEVYENPTPDQLAKLREQYGADKIVPIDEVDVPARKKEYFDAMYGKGANTPEGRLTLATKEQAATKQLPSAVLVADGAATAADRIARALAGQPARNIDRRIMRARALARM